MQPVDAFTVEKSCKVYTYEGKWEDRTVRLSNYDARFVRIMERVFFADEHNQLPNSSATAATLVQKCISFIIAFDQRGLKAAKKASESPLVSVRNVVELVPGVGPGCSVARKLIKRGDYNSLSDELLFWSGFHGHPVAALFAKGARSKAKKEGVKAATTVVITGAIMAGTFGLDMGCGGALASTMHIPDLCASGVMEAFSQAAERLAGFTVEPAMDRVADHSFPGLDCKTWLTYLWALPRKHVLDGKCGFAAMTCERLRLALRVLMGSPLESPFEVRPQEEPTPGDRVPRKTWTVTPGQVSLLLGCMLFQPRIEERQCSLVWSALWAFSKGLSCMTAPRGFDGLYTFTPPNLLDMVRHGVAKNSEGNLDSVEFWCSLHLPDPH